MNVILFCYLIKEIQIATNKIGFNGLPELHSDNNLTIKWEKMNQCLINF